ncbi:MAG: hypothetical protein HeimC2_29280 [Candidatus Heimdallarchaeota archaeon LC_2]|nr:MAG: hypothetical protein HeimC2_29280 [Candidatus Heimdallarchaeota archaeon LC_2]
MTRLKYGIDTVAILRYLTGTLPSRVDTILSKAEDNKIDLVIPSIVVGELIYTIEKGKLVSGKQIHKDKLDLIITTLLSSHIFSIRDLTPSGWEIFINSNIPELHDRLIVATCLQENVEALITSDQEILEGNEISVVWS